MRRIRNVAFLGLLVTLVWAGQARVRADSGGFFCVYGYCQLTYYGENCGNIKYEDIRGGNCEITSTNSTECYWDSGCNEGSGAYWVQFQSGGFETNDLE